MSTLDFMTDVSTPTAIIVAGHDSVVPASRTEPLRRVIPNLVFDRVIPEAEHNDLYELPEFWGALGVAVQEVLRSDADAGLSSLAEQVTGNGRSAIEGIPLATSSADGGDPNQSYL